VPHHQSARVLYFTNPDVKEWRVRDFLSSQGCEVFVATSKPSLDYVKDLGVNWLVADRARQLISSEVIEFLEYRALNLHPSLLPWNRGYNSLMWSAADATPHGVTVHWIDEGIDSGPIVARTELAFRETTTLSQAYEATREAMVSLFQSVWPMLADSRGPLLTEIVNDSSLGTLHSRAQSEELISRLPSHWETPLGSVISLAEGL
jgi:methionyl-tRNA formyltransferase